MSLKQLTLQTLQDLDFGKASMGFQRLLTQAVLDCINRPADDRIRKITMQLNLKPVAETVGNTISCEGAKGVFQMRLHIPDMETPEVDFGVRENGMLVFNEDSPREHRQGTFLPEEEEQ